MLVEANGIPIGLALDGANRRDCKLLKATLDALIVHRPQPTEDSPQHMCLDKAYDSATVRQTLADWGYTAHIRRRSEEAAKRALPHYRARRWVAERTHSWMNRFRRLLVRWEKKVANYAAMLHFACAFIAFRAAGFFG